MGSTSTHDIIPNCSYSWAIEVGTVPTPHADLEVHLVDTVHHEGFEEAFVDVLLDVPHKLRKVVSGGRCLRFRSLKTERFLKQLFLNIVQHSPEKVVLEPYDLAHGHIVKTEDDVLIVFHAKEFPKEYRHSTVAPVLPIGDAAMGGPHDPRTGTPHSVKDETYHLRNYIYVLSQNKTYLVDPKCESFPTSLLSGTEFWTLDEWKLGDVVGDVNYFPDYGVLACPRHTSWATKMGHVLSKVQAKAPCASEEQLAAMGAFSKEVVSLLKEDARCLRETLQDLEQLFKTASEEDLNDIGTASLGGLSHEVRQCVSRHAQSMLCEKKEAKQLGNEKHKAELVGKGVCKYIAEEFLEITSTQHGYSAFRAMQVLEVVHPKYRSEENRKTFGERSYKVEVAVSACSIVHHADSALEALNMHEEHGVAVDTACHTVVRNKEEQTRLSIKRWQEEQLARSTAHT